MPVKKAAAKTAVKKPTTKKAAPKKAAPKKAEPKKFRPDPAKQKDGVAKKNKFETVSKATLRDGHKYDCSVGKDAKGYFVYTHRARSKSYESPAKIPKKDIEFIDSTC